MLNEKKNLAALERSVQFFRRIGLYRSSFLTYAMCFRSHGSFLILLVHESFLMKLLLQRKIFPKRPGCSINRLLYRMVPADQFRYVIQKSSPCAMRALF